MNRQQLSDMLRLQDKLNCVINPDWQTADYPWMRALYMEAAETLDHVGWKWWKHHDDVELDQVKLELVDIWHFFLSHVLVLHEGDYEATAIQVADYFDQLESDPDAFGEISTVPSRTLFDLIIGSAAIQRQLNGPAFNMLMKRFGLTWDELYTTYVAKNVLNLFRQANGYKDGTYVKDWNGEEDNAVLSSTMRLFPDYGPDQLLKVLGQQYEHAMNSMPL